MVDMRYYAIIIGSLLFFLGAAIWFNINKSVEHAYTSNQLPTEEDITRLSLKDPMADTDGDGLINWQEDLYFTNKRNADTDGDGISDFVEIGQGTDPTSQLQTVGTDADVSVLTEDVESYVFGQTNPSFDVASLIRTSTQLKTSDTHPDDSSPSRTDFVHEIDGLNQLATVMENTTISSQQDLQVLSGYIDGSVNNSDALNSILESSRQASAGYGRLHQSLEDATVAEFALLLQDHSDVSVHVLEQIVELGPGQSENPASGDLWQQYSDLQTRWLEIVTDIHNWVGVQHIPLHTTEPGGLFLFNL